jgi:predicted porin
MRPLVTILAALLAVTASAQTAAPPALEKDTGPAATSPVRKEDVQGFTIKAADGTLTVYGLIDLTLGTQDNMNATGGRQTGFRTAWLSGNRWGFLTRHLVSEDLDVIGKLEGEYTIADGDLDTANVLFNRDAWVGFDSKLAGQFTFGRQNTLSRDFAQNYGDAYGSAGVRMDEGGWTNTNNFKQMIYYAAGIGGGTRVDRGINWKKQFGRFMLGAAYAMGNQVDQFSKNGTGSVGAAWNGGLYNFSGYYTQVNNNNLVNKAYAIGGNVQPFKLLRINAGYFHYTADQGTWGTRTDNAYTVSVKVAPAATYDFELGYQQMMAKNAARTGTGTSLNTVNAFKDLSTVTVTSVGTGNRNTLYGSAFYHMTRRAEIYLAADYLMLTDEYKWSAGYGHSNVTEVVAGMRFKF